MHKGMRAEGGGQVVSKFEQTLLGAVPMVCLMLMVTIALQMHSEPIAGWKAGMLKRSDARAWLQCTEIFMPKARLLLLPHLYPNCASSLCIGMKKAAVNCQKQKTVSRPTRLSSHDWCIGLMRSHTGTWLPQGRQLHSAPPPSHARAHAIINAHLQSRQQTGGRGEHCGSSSVAYHHIIRAMAVYPDRGEGCHHVLPADLNLCGAINLQKACSRLG